MPQGDFYLYPSYSSNTTWTIGNATTWQGGGDMKATITIPDVPVVTPPQSEVEKLMAEVEGVCALAR